MRQGDIGSSAGRDDVSRLGIHFRESAFQRFAVDSCLLNDLVWWLKETSTEGWCYGDRNGRPAELEISSSGSSLTEYLLPHG